jgi:hypothetical protein
MTKSLAEFRLSLMEVEEPAVARRNRPARERYHSCAGDFHFWREITENS